jgi:rhamnose utilization protein RhaD (predicted bifunctional aldolase and dehydrogenase)
VFDLNPPRCSIDTPLHTLVPFKHVDHLHPNAVIAVAASVNRRSSPARSTGTTSLYVPWQRPDFDIGLLIERLIKVHPKARGIVLGHHGMSSWSDDDKTCYDTALEIVDRASRYIEARDKGEKTFGGDESTPRFRTENGAGPRRRSCPGCAAASLRSAGWWAPFRTTTGCCASWAAYDGPAPRPRWARRPGPFLRPKIRPLFADWDPADRRHRRLERPRWTAASNSTGKTTRPTTSAAADPIRRPCATPARRLVLVPGLGMFAFGKSKSESRVTAEFYNCAI